MDSDQLLSLIAPFGGLVFALDQIPKEKVASPFYAIINVQESHLGGLHWLAIAIRDETDGRKIYYFDSLGIMPSLKPIVNFININYANHLEINKFQIQHPESDTCGLYCLAFLKSMNRGESFASFLSQFQAPLIENDRKIIDAYNKSVTLNKSGILFKSSFVKFPAQRKHEAAPK
jgi:hypothetical protein